MPIPEYEVFVLSSANLLSYFLLAFVFLFLPFEKLLLFDTIHCISRQSPYLVDIVFLRVQFVGEVSVKWTNWLRHLLWQSLLAALTRTTDLLNRKTLNILILRPH